VAAEQVRLGADAAVGTVYADDLDAHADATVRERHRYDEY
jgi:hypothetical protein